MRKIKKINTSIRFCIASKDLCTVKFSYLIIKEIPIQYNEVFCAQSYQSINQMDCDIL